MALALAALASAQDTAAGTPQAAPPWLERAIGTAPVLAQQAAAGRQQAEAPDPASRTEFRGLDAEEAADAASSAFPTLLQEPVDLGPDLHKGERIVGYQAPDIAKIALPDGGRAVADSVLPMLTETAAGKEVPVDLALGADSDSIGPLHPLVAVEIPRDLAEGIALPESGITLTALSAAGDPLHGAAGRVEGATAFFANTQADTDTLAKPLPLGFETQTILRSPASPEELRFAIAAGGDTTLSEAEDGSVAVERDGETVATVAPVTAVDAAGAPVALSEELDGEELVIEVGHRDGPYQYPIAVDPTVNQSDSFEEAEGTGNWTYGSNASSIFAGSRSNSCRAANAGCLKIADPSNAKYSYGQGGVWSYQTQGSSKIYELDTYFEGITSVETKAAAIIGIVNTSKSWEAEKFLGYEGGEYGVAFGKGPHTACAAGGCASSGGSASNVAVDELVATGNGEFAESDMLDATVKIAQSEGPSASFDTSSKEIEGKPNALYGGQWVKSSSAAKIKATGTDPGLGIYKRALTAPSYSGWSKKIVLGAATGCVGVQCDSPYSFQAEVGDLPEGENTVEAKVENATGSSATKTATVKIDNTAPTITVDNLPEDGVVALGHTYHLKFTFADGKSPTASSGIAANTTEVKIDGKIYMSTGGYVPGCTPGPCQEVREGPIKSSSYGAGAHTMTLTAKDIAGNSTTTTRTFVVKSGPMIDIGPGKLDAASGTFSYATSDVSPDFAGAGLSVTRTSESSIIPTIDPRFTGSIAMNWGGGWLMSLGGWQGITKLSDGSVLLTDPRGRAVVFEALEGGKFKVPAGYEGWTLTYSEAKPDTYTLTDVQGDVTTFQRPSESGSFYVAHSFEGPNGTGQTTFAFKELGDKKFHPDKVVGSVPPGVSCTSPERGCRILHFNYNGSYQLTSISLEAWDPHASKMTNTQVVAYEYYVSGYLKAAWDPRISPALKTTYGYYETTDYMTGWMLASISPPGQQPWLLRYHFRGSGEYRGWLTSASRPSESTSLEPEAAAPKNETKPHQSRSHPIVGVARHVWNGSWSSEPLAYSYQWETCDKWDICEPVIGAYQQTYTPVKADVGKYLRVKVLAVNAGGGNKAMTTRSSAVIESGTPHYEKTCELEGGNEFEPHGIAVDPANEHVWVVDLSPESTEEGAYIKEYAPECGELLSEFGEFGEGPGEFRTPLGISMNSAGELFVADYGNDRIQVVKQNGEFVREFGTSGPGALWAPTDVEIGGEGELAWVVDASGVASFSENGVFKSRQYNWSKHENGPGYYGWKTTSFGDLWSIAIGLKRSFIAETGWGEGTHFVHTFDSYYRGVAFLPRYEQTDTWPIVAMKPEGNAGNVVVAATEEQEGDEVGRVYSYDQEELAEQGPEDEEVIPEGEIGYEEELAPPTALAVGPEEEVVVASNESDSLAIWALTEEEDEGEVPPANPEVATVTVDYEVPVSGEGAPHQMDSASVAEWGQEKTPVWATAILPPDAVPTEKVSDYKRATIYYMDMGGRNIDTAVPGGGIETHEYDLHENMTRELSPSNRQEALDLEGSSKERAELSHELDTQYSFGEEGQELNSVLGPKHAVKLDNGSEVQARLKTRYFYDEGAPGGKTYHLPTKETEAALVGSEEKDIKTKTFGYSGQGNLGWELGRPTTTTIDPDGLDLVETTAYDSKSGDVIEMIAPPHVPALEEAAGMNFFGLATFEPVGYSKSGQLVCEVYAPSTLQPGSTGTVDELEMPPASCYGTDELATCEMMKGKSLNLPWGLEASAGKIDLSGFEINAEFVNCPFAEATLEFEELTLTPDKSGAIGAVDVSGEGVLQTPGGEFGVKASGNLEVEEPGTLGIGTNDEWIRPGKSATLPEQSIYYTAGKNERLTACGKHPEWAGLLCKTRHGASLEAPTPGTAGGVSCTSANACKRVGWAPDGSGSTQLVESWNGSTWSPVETPSISKSSLAGISCTSSSACTAVGGYTSGGELLPLVERWNGSKWSQQEISKPAGYELAYLDKVSCASSSECVAIGRYWKTGGEMQPWIERWNGSSWSQETVAVPGGSKEFFLRGVSCASSSTCFIASSYTDEKNYGRALVETWNGSNWSAQTLTPSGSVSAMLRDVSCTSSTACTAVGSYRVEKTEYALALVERWNGTSWSQQTAANPGGSYTAMTSVSCSSSEACTATGEYNGANQQLVERWNGTSWSQQTVPVPAEGGITLKGLSCPTTSACVSVGGISLGENEIISEHWDGSAWTLKGTPIKQEVTLPSVIISAYNVWNEPIVSGEAIEGTFRAVLSEYDAAGRPLKSTVIASEGKELPSVGIAYDEETGMPVAQFTKEKVLESEYDSLGRLIAYSDADGNISTYAYDANGRLSESYDGKSTKTYNYDSETGYLTELEDLDVGTFHATYDIDGRLASETSPGGLKAIHSYDATGSPVKLNYEKTTKCSKECTWYSEEELASIQGKTRSSTSTLGSFGYTYDAAGRLTKATDTPTGEGCTTRLYSYDANTNITGMTTRSPAGGGACAEAGGTTVLHEYDVADRLLDGAGYDPFGDIIELSAENAGGSELYASYYTDGTTAELSQNGVNIEYKLDPLGRQRQTITSGESEGEAISHFSSSGDAPAWTEDGEGWTRYVSGIGGGLGAIQSSGAETQLQIADMKGSLIAQVSNSEAASALEFTGKAGEYGAPKEGETPKKYSWLGSAQRSTEFPSGVVSMGARTYVPAIGRFLQPDPVPGGSPNAYAYTWGDPVNQTDLGGEYTPTFPTWLLEVIGTAPSMPPPPPPPAVEGEGEMKAISGGGWGVSGGGGAWASSSSSTPTVVSIMRYLRSFLSHFAPLDWGGECIPTSELSFKVKVANAVFDTGCLPKLRVSAPHSEGEFLGRVWGAKMAGFLWCALINAYAVNLPSSIPSLAWAVSSAGHFCGGERAWAYVHVV